MSFIWLQTPAAFAAGQTHKCCPVRRLRKLNLIAPEWYEVRGTDLLLRLRIQPRASHEGIDGLHDGRLRVRVCAPPVDGAANERLILIMALALDVPRSTVRLTRGSRSMQKEILVLYGAARCTALIARLTASF